MKSNWEKSVPGMAEAQGEKYISPVHEFFPRKEKDFSIHSD